jgi:Tol biopolymer transport system component
MISVYEWNANRKITEIHCPGELGAVAFSPDSKSLAIVTDRAKSD